MACLVLTTNEMLSKVILVSSVVHCSVACVKYSTFYFDENFGTDPFRRSFPVVPENLHFGHLEKSPVETSVASESATKRAHGRESESNRIIRHLKQQTSPARQRC